MTEPIHITGPRDTGNINQGKRKKCFGKLKRVLVRRKLKKIKK